MIETMSVKVGSLVKSIAAEVFKTGDESMVTSMACSLPLDTSLRTCDEGEVGCNIGRRKKVVVARAPLAKLGQLQCQ